MSILTIEESIQANIEKRLYTEEYERLVEAMEYEEQYEIDSIGEELEYSFLEEKRHSDKYTRAFQSEYLHSEDY